MCVCVCVCRGVRVCVGGCVCVRESGKAYQLYTSLSLIYPDPRYTIPHLAPDLLLLLQPYHYGHINRG